jgi:hypothetical protein
VRNVWGGPPNGLDNGGAKPALGLAYAPRQNVQLASFLRTDVETLDLKASGVAPSGVGTYASAPPAPPVIAAPVPDAGAPAGEPTKSGCLGCTVAQGDGRGPLAFGLAACGALLVFARRRRRA